MLNTHRVFAALMYEFICFCTCPRIALMHTQAMLSTPNLTTELAALAAARVRLSPLLRVLTSTLVTRIASATDKSTTAMYEATLLALVHSNMLEQVRVL